MLWEGSHLRVLVLLEWALEQKLRRIHNGMQSSKRGTDINDALALLRHLKMRNGGLLEREYIRTLDICSTEMVPDHGTMDEIATTYGKKYHEEAFA